MGSQFIPSHHILLKIGSFNTTFNVFYFIYLCVYFASPAPSLIDFHKVNSTCVLNANNCCRIHSLHFLLAYQMIGKKLDRCKVRKQQHSSLYSAFYLT